MKIYDVPPEKSRTDLGDVEGIGEAVDERWNYPEWSNHPYFSAAAIEVRRLWKADGGGFDETWKGEAVYAINLKDSTYIKLIESSDTSQTTETHMRWPWLWVDTEGLQEDAQWLQTPGY
jgi:hypothetical protein